MKQPKEQIMWALVEKDSGEIGGAFFSKKEALKHKWPWHKIIKVKVTIL